MNPDKPPVIIDKGKINKYLVKLNELKSQYSDEISSELVHSNDKDSKFKVRKGWFTTVTLWLGSIEKTYKKGSLPISAALVDRINETISLFTSKEFVDKERVAREDIDTANGIIDETIRELERVLQ